MKIFKVGSQIQQTFKNVARLRVIVNVMLRYGFAEILQRIDIGKFVPFTDKAKRESRRAETAMTMAERVRRCFEDLGPTFMKLGQLLSIRPDLVPEDFIKEFKKLQDKAAEVPTKEIKAVIQEELGAPVEKVFLDFEEKPLASASIAQVHGALLPDGTEVVLKVRRPGIKRLVDTDLSILMQLAQMIERYIPESRVFNPTGIVVEFKRNLDCELNFSLEANNVKRISGHFEKDENIVIPLVYGNLSTKRVLTLQRLRGIPFNDKGALIREGVDLPEICKSGAHLFFRMVYINGLFHSDPHGGNLFCIDGTKIGLLDFGSVGRLSQKTRDGLANMFLGIASEDYEVVVNEYLEMGTIVGKVDVPGFTRACREIVEPNLGLPLKDVNVGKLVRDLAIAASKYNIRMSQDLMLLSRALLTIEGVGRNLDPEFDLFGEMGEFVREIVKSRYSPQRITKELLWMAQDMTSFLKVLPRQLKHLLTRLANDEFSMRVEVEGLRQEMAESTRSRQLLSVVVLISTIWLCSTFLITSSKGILFLGFSIIGLVGYAAGAFLLFLAFTFLFRRKRS
ncbi:ABC1 kinase family protein [Bdellovibrionota bacterium]